MAVRSVAGGNPFRLDRAPAPLGFNRPHAGVAMPGMMPGMPPPYTPPPPVSYSDPYGLAPDEETDDGPRCDEKAEAAKGLLCPVTVEANRSRSARYRDCAHESLSAYRDFKDAMDYHVENAGKVYVVGYMAWSARKGTALKDAVVLMEAAVPIVWGVAAYVSLEAGMYVGSEGGIRAVCRIAPAFYGF